MNVGKSMIDENYAHHYGNAEEKEVYGNRVKNSFYVWHQLIYLLTCLLAYSLTHAMKVDNVKWKKNVLKRGLKVVFQSLDYNQREEATSVSEWVREWINSLKCAPSLRPHLVL